MSEVNPNLTTDPAKPAHSYVAERRIAQGEELTINYGDEYAEWHGWT